MRPKIIHCFFAFIFGHFVDVERKWNKEKYTIKEREQDLLDALESSDENSKKVKMCKKRLRQVSINI